MAYYCTAGQKKLTDGSVALLWSMGDGGVCFHPGMRVAICLDHHSLVVTKWRSSRRHIHVLDVLRWPNAEHSVSG